MNAVRKTFGTNGVTALDGADFCVKSGEIHALLGENGAGKSTLMHILAGFLRPDSGSVMSDGTNCETGMVRQWPARVPGLSVWENCVLGTENGTGTGGPGLLAPYRKRARSLAADINKARGFGLPLDMPVEKLSESQCRLAAVLSLLLRDTRFLIFDEVTAGMGKPESEPLFELWRSLAAEGRGIVLISHKLEETLSVSENFTVLRRGKTVLSGACADYPEELILSAIFGKSEPRGEASHLPASPPGGSFGTPPGGGRPPRNAHPILTAERLSVRAPGFAPLRNVSFCARRGEIVGIAGLRESGTDTLELALTGFLRRGVSGKVSLGGTDYAGRGPLAFRNAGGAYLVAGRKAIGRGAFIVPQDERLSLRQNLLIHAHRRFLLPRPWQKIKLFDGKKISAFINDILAKADIQRDGSEKLGTLSGGMGRRLAGIREFAEDPALIVLSEPTWGMDRQRRERFFRYVRERADEGRAIIIFFSDADDIDGTADRFLVLRGGEIAEVPDPASVRRATVAAVQPEERP